MTGNPNAVAQAIRALSGGNPSQVANLVAAVFAFAEKQLPANPGAGAAALGGLALLQDKAVFNAAPAQVQDALAAAERIGADPNMINAQPDAAAKLAAEVLRVRTQLGLIANGPAPAPAPVPPLNQGDKGKDAAQDNPQPPAEDVVVQQVIDQAAAQAAGQAIGGAVEQVINQDIAPAMNLPPCSGSTC